MTPQELYDTVVLHLRKQNCKAEKNDTCQYRQKSGDIILKCAVGCLIPDEEYSTLFEGRTISGLLDESFLPFPKTLKKLLIDHIDLLIDLQLTHDEFPIYQWEDRFKIIAKKNNLQWIQK